MNDLFKRLIPTFIIIILAFLLGSTWSLHYYFIGFVILVPFFWFYYDFKKSSIFIYFYYLFSTKSLPEILIRYKHFHPEMIGSSFLYPFIWILFAFILASPWILTKKILFKENTPRFLKVISPVVPIIIIFVPPLYILGIASPLEAVGILFPGFKLFGILLFFTLLILNNIIIQIVQRKHIIYNFNFELIRILPFYLIYLTIVFIDNYEYRNPKIPLDWVAISTNFESLSFDENRLQSLIYSIKLLIKEKYHVIILPENAVGIWTINNNIFSNIINYAKKNNSIVLSGAYVRSDDIKQSKYNINYYDSSIIAFGKINRVVYLTRQPIPIAGWIPFSSHGLNVHWFSKGIQVINHKKVSFFVCFEELLPGLISTSFLSKESPNIIISVVNNWVGYGTGESKAQFNSIYVMSRLFGTAFLRSWNR